jgi:hypothetical protein
MATLLEIAARLQSMNAIENMLLVVAKATLILAIARLLLLVLPRASAATKHLVATAALVSVAAMPVMTLVVPAWNVVVEQPPAQAPAAQAPLRGSSGRCVRSAPPTPSRSRDE